jgi:hypothetical protein
MTRIRALAPLLLGLTACQPPPDERPPLWCEPSGELELGCTGAGCVAAVMVDYFRLEPRGFIVRTLTQTSPVTALQAEAAAVDHVTKVLGARTPDVVDSDRAGDFFNCFLLYQSDRDGYNANDSWLVVIHAGSGEVVFAGLEIWNNPKRGPETPDPPLPTGWQGPAPLGCSDGAGEPQGKALITTGQPMGSPPSSTAKEAWEQVGRRLNLTEQFTAGKPYRVMVISFSTAIGEFDPWAADWLVWLTRDP